MSIIYSYPTATPVSDDLVIGTDTSENATRSFTIGAIAAVVGELASTGTVTSVQIATDTFLLATGGPIVDAGTITIGLTATGTPSATTFLRGDNKWASAVLGSGVSIAQGGTTLADNLLSLNFTGNGVTVSSDVEGNARVVVAATPSTITSVNPGNGISVNSTIGDVTVTNSGVLSLIEGSGIAIASSGPNGTGNLTISSQNSSTGTVTSVNANDGLLLQDITTAQVTPVIGMALGTDNYINQTATVTPTQNDLIPIDDVSGTAVKNFKIGDLPVSAVPLIQAAIGDNTNNIINTYDKDNAATVTLGVAPAFQVVTLTQAKYDGLSTSATPAGPGYDPNFLYFTIPDGSAVSNSTVTLSIQNNIVGTNFQITGDTTGAQRTGPQGSAISGTAAGAYSTQVSATGAFRFSASNPLTIVNGSPSPAGNFPLAATGAVQTIIGGTLEAIPPSSAITSTLARVNNNINLNDNADTAYPGGTPVYQILTATPTLSSAPGAASFTYNPASYGVTLSLRPSSGTYISSQWEIKGVGLPVVEYNPDSQQTITSSRTSDTATVNASIAKKLLTCNFTSNTTNVGGGAAGTDYNLLFEGNAVSPGAITSFNPTERTFTVTNSITPIAASNLASTITASTATGGTATVTNGQAVISIVIPDNATSIDVSNNVTVTSVSNSKTVNITTNTSAITSPDGVVPVSAIQYNPYVLQQGNNSQQASGPNVVTFTANCGVAANFSGGVGSISNFTNTFANTLPATNPMNCSVSNVLDITNTITGTIFQTRTQNQAGPRFTNPQGEQVCQSSLNGPTFFLKKVTPGSTNGPETGDIAFTTSNGSTKLPNGEYKVAGFKKMVVSGGAITVSFC